MTDAEQLGVHVNSPLSEVSGALASLSDRGMIAVNDDSYALTDDGQSKSNQCGDLAIAHAADTFNSFSDERVENFKDVLRQIIQQQ